MAIERRNRQKKVIVRTEALKDIARSMIESIEPDVERPYVVEVYRISDCRSNQANRKMHALFRAIADYTGFTPAEVKELMRRELLEPVGVIRRADGSLEEVWPSTTNMKVDEMARFIEKIQAYAFEHFGFVDRHGIEDEAWKMGAETGHDATDGHH